MTVQDALVWEGGNVVAVRPVPVPESRPGWVALDVAYAGICGSDLHIADGEHDRAQPGTVLGHEFVGHLAEPYSDLPAGHPVLVNPTVHCLGLKIVDTPDDLDNAADVVFDASGHTSVARELFLWLRAAGTAVIVGAYQPGLHGVDLLSVMFGEITIMGTRIYQRSDIEAAIELVTTGRLDAHQLISKIFPLEEAVTAIDTLRRGEEMKILIKPDQARAT